MPGALSSESERTVWTQSTTSAVGFDSAMARSIASRSFSGEQERSVGTIAPSRRARAAVCAALSSPET